MPAFAGFIDPVLNTEAQPISKDEGTIKMEMTKEELITLIKDTVVAMNTAPAEVKDEEKKEETEESCNAEANVEQVNKEETVAENACAEETKNEAPAEEVKPEEANTEETAAPAEEKKEEVEEEEKKEEVIKIEALNSAPVVGTDISGKSGWQNLHGDAFWKYLREHPEVR